MTRKRKKWIVNGLTLSRLVGAICVPLIFARVDFVAFIILLIFLFVTDFLDGRLARRWEVQTIGGSLLDPLGDKVLAVACILSLIKWYHSMGILVGLELMITVLNVLRVLRYENVASSIIGKCKTWILSITLVLGAASLFWPSIISDVASIVGLRVNFTVTEELVEVVSIIAICAEIVTLVAYLFESLRSKKSSEKRKRRMKNIKELLVRLFDEEKFEEDRNKSIVDIIMQ